MNDYSRQSKLNAPAEKAVARKVDLSIVIPVYRSRETLPRLVERLTDVLDTLGRTYEIIFIDDGSPDHSFDALRELQRRHPASITVVQLMRNYGQHNALMCGFRHVNGEYVITLDDDLQNPPEEIPKLIEAIERDNLDLVYGCPDERRHHAFRNVGSSLINLFYRTVYRLPVRVTPFRVMRRQLVESILSYELNFTFVDGLLGWNTQRVGQVTVEHHPRKNGRSGYSIPKLLVLALNLFTNFSLLPLQFVSMVGFVASLGGMLTALYYLYCYLFGQITVPGYASTIVAILVLGGVQLLSLGLIGEYLGRLHLNVNRKPQYTERTILQASSSVDHAIDASMPATNPHDVSVESSTHD